MHWRPERSEGSAVAPGITEGGGAKTHAANTVSDFMSILSCEPYDPSKSRSAVLQPRVPPLSVLHRPWFKNKIVSDDGWSLSFSGDSWRIDRYDYFEEDQHVVLSGEGAAGQMDIFITKMLRWDKPPDVVLDERTRERVLYNITSALQWAGFSVGFFALDDPKTPE